MLQNDIDQIYGGQYSLDIQCNHRWTHIEQIEDSGVDLPHNNEVPNEDWYQRAEKQPKGVVPVLPYDSLPTKEGPT